MTTNPAEPHLALVIKGVAGELSALAECEWEDVQRAAARTHPVLGASAVARVLHGFVAGEVTAATAQRWASFLRWGDFEGSTPRVGVDIEYEESRREEIADAIARLDELGDLIDGEIGPHEALDLITRLET